MQMVRRRYWWWRRSVGSVDWRTGQVVEGTDWRKGAKEEQEAKERAVVRGKWLRSVDRDCVYDRG